MPRQLPSIRNLENKVTVSFLNGSESRTLVFHNVTNLIGSSGNDTIYFKNGAPFEGSIYGGGGINKVDYSSFGKAVKVNLIDHTVAVNVDDDNWVNLGRLLHIHDVSGGVKSGLFHSEVVKEQFDRQ